MRTAVATAVAEPVNKPDVEQPRAWNVVLLDDDDHTYQYVMELAQRYFGASPERAFEIAKTVDTEGRVILTTTHRELAELKQEQVHSFGADPLMSRSAGPMTAVLEPV